MKSKNLQEYYKACNRLVDEFAKKYLPDEEWEWMGEIGSVLSIGNYLLEMNHVVQVMELLPTFEIFDEAYWYVVDKKPKISFKNYLKYGKIV